MSLLSTVQSQSRHVERAVEHTGQDAGDTNECKDQHAQGMVVTDHIVNARKRLPGPPSRRVWPIWTYNTVPIVPPMPVTRY